MTVAELSERMSSKELSEWIQFYRLEPFGTEINMFGHAVVASTVYNMLKGKKGKKLEPKDFIPDFEREAQPKSIDDLMSFVETMNKAMSGKDNRVGR